MVSMERVKTNRKRVGWFYGIGLGWIAAVLLVLGICCSANAFVISDDEELGMRWDNTIRYNYGVRARSPQGILRDSANYNDGDLNFNKGTVTNRLDLLSEFDLIYKKDFGFRVSGAFWYDQRYREIGRASCRERV